MKYLFKEAKKWAKKLSGSSIFLFLDYDGTLVPIARTPDEAIASDGVKKLLSELSQLHQCRLAIISGRSLKDIKRIIGLKGVIYAGNHGLELEGPGISLKKRVPLKSISRIRLICEVLKRKLSKIKGVLIEDKGLTLSLHYRLASRKDMPTIKNIFYESVADDMFKGSVAVKTGKKVLELRPVAGWDKGKVVSWLLDRQFLASKRGVRHLPVYIGDDITDEDAFKVLRSKGLTVFVGRPKISYARYYLKNTREVLRFLREITELKKKR